MLNKAFANALFIVLETHVAHENRPPAASQPDSGYARRKNERQGRLPIANKLPPEPLAGPTTILMNPAMDPLSVSAAPSASARSGPASQALLQTALVDSVRLWAAQRRERVDGFCARHFSFGGALRIHRLALGHDLWRAPANALWAAPYLASQAAGFAAGKLGWQGAGRKLKRLPPGFRTAVARELEWLVYAELLELPINQGTRTSARDALLETLLAHEAVAGLLLPELLALDALSGLSQTRAKLEEFFAVYAGNRIAAADMAGSVLNLAAGAAAFQKFTPGAFALGAAVASGLAQQLAIANFALGSTLGSLYYGLFPATASAGLTAASVGGAMAALGVFAAFAGVLTDPVQRATGLHRRRLLQLVDAVEGQLTGAGGDFKLRDAYVARVFDLVDLIRGAAQTLR
jgi:hypothetical protein